MTVRHNLYIFLICFFLSVCCAEQCKGFDCMRNYIDKPEPAYKWSDTGVSSFL